MAQKPTDLMTIWDEKTERITESGCWLWLGGTDKDGYGRFSVNGEMVRAHVTSYRHFRGPVTKQVLHKCNVRCCVNPEHLYLGNEVDNARDRDACGNTLKGVKHGMSKLTEVQVLEIARRLKNGESNFWREMGVSKHDVANIKRGQTWTALTGFRPYSVGG